MSNFKLGAAPTRMTTPSNHIETYRDGGIRYSTANFLDEQIMEAVKDCLENNKIKPVDFLQHLQKVNREGI